MLSIIVWNAGRATSSTAALLWSSIALAAYSPFDFSDTVQVFLELAAIIRGKFSAQPPRVFIDKVKELSQGKNIVPVVVEDGRVTVGFGGG